MSDEIYEELVPQEIPEDTQEEEKDVTLFELIRDISEKGTYIQDYLKNNGRLPKVYNQYVINKVFASYPDTVFLANELNKIRISDYLHWSFLDSSVKKNRRFSKWYKEQEDENIELLAHYFGCSVREMYKNVSAMPKEELKTLIKDLRNDRRNK